MNQRPSKPANSSATCEGTSGSQRPYSDWNCSSWRPSRARAKARRMAAVSRRRQAPRDLLFARLGYGAVDLRVHADVVQRPGEDRDQDGAGLRTRNVARVVVALGTREYTNDQ